MTEKKMLKLGCNQSSDDFFNGFENKVYRCINPNYSPPFPPLAKIIILRIMCFLSCSTKEPRQEEISSKIVYHK